MDTCIQVISPASGVRVGAVAITARPEIEAAARRLRANQPAWHRLGVSGRGYWLARWRDWLLDHSRDLVSTVQLETGKSWGDASSEMIVFAINYWIDNAQRFLADRRVRPHGAINAIRTLSIGYEPYPLVGVITPWNAPLAAPLVDIPAALMAGCAVLSKPSEVTPLTWQLAVEGWREIGAPDVLDAVYGHGETGASLVDVVDYVMFTGSVETGRKVAVASAARLIPYSLELGGKDAMIVCADADVDRAVEGALWGGFAYSGQICISVERLYVEEPIYEQFVTKLVARVAQLRQGMDIKQDFSCDIGSLTTEAQLRTVSRHVEDAIHKGARVLVGGKPRGDGLFFEPTVLVDVDHTMDCMREETFGPTLPVMKVRDAAEAIEYANDSRFGLSGSIWTGDRAKAQTLARQMRTGSVHINNVLLSIAQTPIPFGGWYDSGVGARNGGADGIRKYCRTRSIVGERMNRSREMNWYPYTPAKGRLQAAVVRFVTARDWRRRMNRNIHT